MTNAKRIKEMAIQKGADICGIAPVDRFADAPEGFHPCDIYPDCRSVIVFASNFPSSTLHAKTNVPYTFVRNIMIGKLDLITFHISAELESEGIISIPIPSSEPYEYWDQDRNHGRGILSLKHAGKLAGLGILGKNTLLINEKYGNMIWLGAILLPVELKPDPVVNYEACTPECTRCIDSCPQHALNGIAFNQKLCRERVFSRTDGGGWVITCNICRKVCPNYNGILQ
jgi:epoxyqueuosine reductase